MWPLAGSCMWQAGWLKVPGLYCTAMCYYYYIIMCRGILGDLSTTEPLLMLLVTPVLFLPWQVKKKRPLITGGSWDTVSWPDSHCSPSCDAWGKKLTKWTCMNASMTVFRGVFGLSREGLKRVRSTKREYCKFLIKKKKWHVLAQYFDLFFTILSSFLFLFFCTFLYYVIHEVRSYQIHIQNTSADLGITGVFILKLN